MSYMTRSTALAGLLCRCQLQTVIPEGGHLRHNTVQCGALVAPGKRLEHVRDVHGVEGLASVDKLDEMFVPVDPDANADWHGEAREERVKRAYGQVKLTRQRRAQLGLCYRCHEYAEPGRKKCARHLEADRKHQAMKQAQKAGGR